MGGLFVATFLTLLFLPGLYALWFRKSLDVRSSRPASRPDGGGSGAGGESAAGHVRLAAE